MHNNKKDMKMSSGIVSFPHSASQNRNSELCFFSDFETCPAYLFFVFVLWYFSFMYLFLFTVVPLYFFLFHELEKKRYAVRGSGFNFFCGAVTSAVYCFVGFLAFTTYRLPEFSFMNNFLYFFLNGTVFPVSCCVLIYLLLGKNSWSFKMLMFSDVIPAFYAVFLPYRIISTYDMADPFFLFVLPCVIVSCLYILRKVTFYIVLTKADLWKKIVFGILAAIVVILFPAVSEALFFIGAPLWLRCLVEFGAVVLAVGSFFLFRCDLSYANERLGDILKHLEIPVKLPKKKADKAEKHAKSKKESDAAESAEMPDQAPAAESAVRPDEVSEPAESAAVNEPAPESEKSEEPVSDSKPKNNSASMPKKSGKKSSGSKKKK